MERHRKATIVRYHARIWIPKDLIATIGAGPFFRVVLTAVVAASLLGLALSSFFLRLPLVIDPIFSFFSFLLRLSIRQMDIHSRSRVSDSGSCLLIDLPPLV